jgi:predicted transcriptional regulator
MKNTIKLIGIIALAAVIVFSMAACNRGVAAPAGLTEVDRAITEYEKLIGEIIPLVERMMQGDEEAMAEFEAFDEVKIEAVMEELERLENQFTVEQTERLSALIERYQAAFGFSF